MAKFAVGMRVRLVAAMTPANLNATGRIAAIGSWVCGDSLPGGRILASPSADCMIEWDQPVVESADGRTVMFSPCDLERLEPILPEGAAPSEFTTLADLLTSLGAEAKA